MLAGLIRLLSLRWSAKLALKISSEIVYKAYNSILNKEYQFHINESKNKLISIIHTNGSYLFREVINPIFIIINSILFISLIFFALLFYNWKLIILVSFVILIAYSYLSKKAKKILKAEGLKQVELRKITLERLDIELSSIEYIILEIFKKYFLKITKNWIKKLRKVRLLAI